VAIDSALVAAAASATNFSPPLTTVGGGGLVGFLIGFIITNIAIVLRTQQNQFVKNVVLVVIQYLLHRESKETNWYIHN
jgi:uncharacterized membrane protein (Fun14 family)